MKQANRPKSKLKRSAVVRPMAAYRQEISLEQKQVDLRGKMPFSQKGSYERFELRCYISEMTIHPTKTYPFSRVLYEWFVSGRASV